MAQKYSKKTGKSKIFFVRPELKINYLNTHCSFPSPSEHDSKQVLLKVLVEVVQLGLVNQESPGDQKALRGKNPQIWLHPVY